MRVSRYPITYDAEACARLDQPVVFPHRSSSITSRQAKTWMYCFDSMVLPRLHQSHEDSTTYQSTFAAPASPPGKRLMPGLPTSTDLLSDRCVCQPGTVHDRSLRPFVSAMARACCSLARNIEG